MKTNANVKLIRGGSEIAKEFSMNYFKKLRKL